MGSSGSRGSGDGTAGNRTGTGSGESALGTMIESFPLLLLPLLSRPLLLLLVTMPLLTSLHAWNSRRNLLLLIVLWLLGVTVDSGWLSLDLSVPSWDPAAHLTRALNYWRLLQQFQIGSGDWWVRFWQPATKYPPLAYASAAPFLQILGPGMDASVAVNFLFGALLLGSVYGLGCLLFSPGVGLGAAAICLVMPGLYQLRLEYLLDYPLVAMITLSWFWLTLWRGGRLGQTWHRVLGAAMFGFTLGLTLLTKQTALLFFIGPLLYLGISRLWQRRWGELLQLLLGGMVAIALLIPWLRVSWLLILTAAQGSTVDPALTEGDPGANSLAGWLIYSYLTWLEVPWMLVPLVLLSLGLGLRRLWRRPQRLDYRLDSPALRRSPESWPAWGWIALFIGSAYVLSSLNPNKDSRYIAPYLPAVALGMAQALAQLPRAMQPVTWLSYGLVVVITATNLFPSPFSLAALSGPLGPKLADTQGGWPHRQVIEQVLQADPQVVSTLGVLPSTRTVNQHNLNYFGLLRQFQVYARQVGKQSNRADAELDSLNWVVTQSPLAPPLAPPLATPGPAVTPQQQAFEQKLLGHPEFERVGSWPLPRQQSQIQLYHRPQPPLEVTPSQGSGPITLQQVLLPERSPLDQPIPVTYTWSGSRQDLLDHLAVITWRSPTNPELYWIHDHSIGLGKIAPSSALNSPRLQVREHLAMQLPPHLAALPAAEGRYQLQVQLLNRRTRKLIATTAHPQVSLDLDAKAPKSALSYPLDPPSQLRNLAGQLWQGPSVFDQIFPKIELLNEYNPGQDFLVQTQLGMQARLQQLNPTVGQPISPLARAQEISQAYSLGLASVLRQDAKTAVQAFHRVTRLDPANPHGYAYLALSHLYQWHPNSAQGAIAQGLKLSPNHPELHLLRGVGLAMQGRLPSAWQSIQQYRQLEKGQLEKRQLEKSR
jgi:4-amino-4-deoxy-L-arabinose transferase-like glycosyltransferase/tetratricopeptide (TPR) repeat protein